MVIAIISIYGMYNKYFDIKNLEATLHDHANIENTQSNIGIDVALKELAIGNPNAPITIIEYASMTCSHCADFHNNIFPIIKQNHIETGEVRFIFREFPIDKLAMATSMLARCVDNNLTLSFIDILFKTRDTWISDDAINQLKALSKQAGLSSEDFDQCLNNQSLLDELINAKENAIKDHNISATPTFIINGKKMTGSKPYSDFQKEIENILDTLAEI